MIHPEGLSNEIEKAVADENIMEILADLDLMNHQLERSVAEVLNELKGNEEYSFISEGDVYALEGWVGVSYKEDDDDEYPFDEDDEYEMEGEQLLRSFLNEYKGNEVAMNVPFKRESFVGRNDPCPCGSGKKYNNVVLGMCESREKNY